MSGVTTETRLEQLLRLRERIELEITQERTKTLGRPRLPGLQPDEELQAAMARRGITSAEVKQWAHRVGLLPVIRRGRVSRNLVAAYLDVHR